MPKTKTPKPAARVYRAASYARLSVDDESYGTSGSVLNQHAMIRDFADAILHDRRPMVDAYEGRKVVDIILAAYESSRTGKEVLL